MPLWLPSACTVPLQAYLQRLSQARSGVFERGIFELRDLLRVWWSLLCLLPLLPLPLRLGLRWRRIPPGCSWRRLCRAVRAARQAVQG